MATYDFGGGCSCGLQRYCDCMNATLDDLRNYAKQHEKDFDDFIKKKGAYFAKQALRAFEKAQAELDQAQSDLNKFRSWENGSVK